MFPDTVHSLQPSCNATLPRSSASPGSGESSIRDVLSLNYVRAHKNTRSGGEVHPGMPWRDGAGLWGKSKALQGKEKKEGPQLVYCTGVEGPEPLIRSPGPRCARARAGASPPHRRS